MKSERAKLIAIIVACVPLQLLTLVSGLFVAIAFNPLTLAFMGGFEVRNDTDEPIWITPIGGAGTSYYGFWRSLDFCLRTCSFARFRN